MSYLTEMLDPVCRKKIIRKVVNTLREFGLERFDAIACRGLSGMLIAPGVAERIKKDLLIVRKGESTHSECHVERGIANEPRYVVVDDCIESGDTLRAIVNEIDRHFYKPNLVGVVLYRHCDRENWTYMGMHYPVMRVAGVELSPGF